MKTLYRWVSVKTLLSWLLISFMMPNIGLVAFAASAQLTLPSFYNFQNKINFIVAITALFLWIIFSFFILIWIYRYWRKVNSEDII